MANFGLSVPETSLYLLELLDNTLYSILTSPKDTERLIKRVKGINTIVETKA